LEEEKKVFNDQMLNCHDPEEAMELHKKIEALSAEITASEDLWLELTEG
jgi:ATP-binding cassette subfamily F protein 3